MNGPDSYDTDREYYRALAQERGDAYALEVAVDHLERLGSSGPKYPLEMPMMDEILLACGEMKAAEMRTVRAALKWFITRANATPHRQK
ncbi:MAG: hypothetical protein ACRD52_00540 [Candidatus Acidiferrales bacterium]